MYLIDAHCHLKQVAETGNLANCIFEAEKKGIKLFLSNALSRQEVWWHQQNQFSQVVFSAGIHPVYDEGTSLNLEDLENLCQTKQIYAIGEIGLDKRNKNLNKQITNFQAQIELARSYDLPIVLHVVGHYDVLYKVLKDQPVRVLWHGFYASTEIIQQFSTLDVIFSLGATIVNSQKHHLINAVINHGRFLLESDAPFHHDEQKYKNPLLHILGIVNAISRMSGRQINELCYMMQQNTKDLLSI